MNPTAAERLKWFAQDYYTLAEYQGKIRVYKIEQGDISILEALKVGATIEDVDIYDLERINGTTDNEDLNKLY